MSYGTAAADCLKNIGRYKIIRGGRTSVSKKPLISFGYYNCNSVILYDGMKMGLSHIGPTRDPEKYILGMIRKMDSHPRAIIVRGYYSKGEEERVCENLDLAIERIFDYKNEGLREETRKDILVIPTTREVLIFTDTNREFRMSFDRQQ